MGTFNKMTRKYNKTFISKNGNNFYLQFHIKDWMRQFPAFIKLPLSKKNYKETLRTSDYNLASERALLRLKELQIINRAKYEPLPVGAEAYWKADNDVKTRTDKDLLKLEEGYDELLQSSLTTSDEHGTEAYVNDKELYSNADNNLKAITRALKERNDKFFDEPHPYPVGLNFISNKYMKELKSEGKASKTQNKVKNASKRFLEYREIIDIELRLITPKIVSDYIKFARTEDRAISTFRNDINYLGAVYEFAKREAHLNNVANPFRGQRMINFKEPSKREPFTNKMIAKLIELASDDKELTQLIYVSYYTGMRLNEIFTTNLYKEENVRVFNVAEKGGKTLSAKRIIPLHSELKKMNLSNWLSPSSTALGKRFGRLKDKMLDELELKEGKNKYVHHSFRHGFSRILLTARYSELEIADLTGHKKSNIGRTQAGKTYFARQPISKLIQMIECLPGLNFAE